MSEGISEERLREGDIYSWRWRDDAKHADNASYRSYHCRSRLAVFKDGFLRDTYWFGNDMAARLDPDAVILTLLGNVNDLVVIRSYEIPYYAPVDIVDMRHANNSHGPIYRRAAATRNADAMREYAQRLRRDAVQEAASAQRYIERMDEALKLIDSGDLANVYF